jgi:hypothetical protein
VLFYLVTLKALLFGSAKIVTRTPHNLDVHGDNLAFEQTDTKRDASGFLRQFNHVVFTI